MAIKTDESITNDLHSMTLSKTSLFNLPPELRLQIFELVYSGSHLEVGSKSWTWLVFSQGAITRLWRPRYETHFMISKQYYNEAIIPFLQNAVWHFPNMTFLENFAHNAPNLLRENVRTAMVVSRIPTSSTGSMWRSQIWSQHVGNQALPGLRKLTLRMDTLNVCLRDDGKHAMGVQAIVDRVIEPSGLLHLRGLKGFEIVQTEDDKMFVDSLRVSSRILGLSSRAYLEGWEKLVEEVAKEVEGVVCQDEIIGQ